MLIQQNPEDGYGGKNYLVKECVDIFMEDYGLEVRVARYHNIYGPYGTYDGGREKAPAALCRKVLEAKKNNENKLKFGEMVNKQEHFYILMMC